MDSGFCKDCGWYQVGVCINLNSAWHAHAPGPHYSCGKHERQNSPESSKEKLTIKCRDCKHLSYGFDPWSEEAIRIVCCHLGTATTMPAPTGWDESHGLPLDFDFDLGTDNQYCMINEQRGGQEE